MTANWNNETPTALEVWNVAVENIKISFTCDNMSGGEFIEIVSDEEDTDVSRHDETQAAEADDELI